MRVLPSAAEDSLAGELPIRLRVLPDERLARLARDGNERAFGVIYERYHQHLYRYCYSILRDGDDAYDALQSTLANALAALQREQRDVPLRPWLFRIAHNETISLIRRREAERRSLDAGASCVPSAEVRADERARLALLVSDLQELPERQRTVLLMRELNGLSHKDIALALGISVHTVGHSILAARRALGEFEEGRRMVCEAVQSSISNSNGRILPRARAHVRDCATCAEFAAAIPVRRADLQALVPPLAPAAAAGLLAGLHGAASTQSAGGGGFMAAGISTKAAGAAFVAKAIAGVAVVAVASAGVTGAVRSAHESGPASVATATTIHASADGHRRRAPRLARMAPAHGNAATAPRGVEQTPTTAASDPGPAAADPSATSSYPGPAAKDSAHPVDAGAAAKAGAASATSSGSQPLGGESVVGHRRHGRGASPGAERSPVAAAHAHANGGPSNRARHEHSPSSGPAGDQPGAPAAREHGEVAHPAPSEPGSGAGARGESGNARGNAPTATGREAEAPSAVGEAPPAPAVEASKGGRGAQHDAGAQSSSGGS
jgi:RNA polymerase sigma factor (sigma-70 family)